MELVQDWGMRKMLFLGSSIVFVTLYMLTVNWFSDTLLPTIEGEGQGAKLIAIGSNHPASVMAKILGGAAIIYLLHKQSTKR